MWDNRSSLQYDWDNLVTLHAKGAEVPWKLNSSVWGNGHDGVEPYSHAGGFGSISGFSGSDTAQVPLMSSKSTSGDSSSLRKTFNVNAFEETRSVSIPLEFAKSKNHVTSSVSLEASVRCFEPVIGLKLGKRTYSEDFCTTGNGKISSESDKPMSSESTRRSRSSYQTNHHLHCQVEGCHFDLSGAKEYHRKHKICDSHSKCPKVIVAGLERRFCQQCSRFHSLSEFDENKRSCRKRLSNHNARRRKPRSEASHFNLDGRQQVGFVLNMGAPYLQTRPPWETCGSNFTLTRDYAPLPEKRAAGTDHQQYLLGKGRSNTVSMLSSAIEDSPTKCTTSKARHDGVGECTTPFNIVAAQDLHSALSLLSTNDSGSCNSDHVPVYHSNHPITTVTKEPLTHTVLQSECPESSELWKTGHQSCDAPAPTADCLGSDPYHLQQFKLCSEMFYPSSENNQLAGETGDISPYCRS
ncbi:hypothetical protein QQ045_015597 [Rhodiola kirilowii]